MINAGIINRRGATSQDVSELLRPKASPVKTMVVVRSKREPRNAALMRSLR